MMAVTMVMLCVLGLAMVAGCEDKRPTPEDRKLVSPAVDTYVQALAARMTGDRSLACLLANTLPNTLDTTVASFKSDGGDAFVVTGDIEAMWLRDSTNQVLPYLRFARASDGVVRALVEGLIRRQAAQVLADPYANAHTLEPYGRTPNVGDSTSRCAYASTRESAMTPGIFERKYELDSLLAFLKLSRSYHNATGGDVRPFGAPWLRAVASALDVFEIMQHSSAAERAAPCGPAYNFERSNLAGQGPLDTLLHGVGSPAAHTGLIRSAFRPSDDATTFAFNVPQNAFAVVELRHTAALLRHLAPSTAASTPTPAVGTPARAAASSKASQLAARCEALARVVDKAISAHGVVHRPRLGGDVYAYEVDGFGNALLMDDANVPSLLSLPYLGYVQPTDEIYQRTRKYVLSNNTNPWFFKGTVAEGVGGPHSNGPGFVWPMAIIMRALTSEDDDEIASALAMLKASAAETGLMHESFQVSNAGDYTRRWFAWANSLFGELIVRLSVERPHLIGIGKQK